MLNGRKIEELSKAEKLKLYEEYSIISEKVQAGEKIPCPECGALLVDITPWGISEWAEKKQYGYGHGVFCPNDERHFSMNYEYK